jgi:Zn-dependent membrane protease YugP
MFFDPLYLAIMAGTALIGFWASWRVKAAFAKFAKVGTRRGLTGAEVAREILQRSGIRDVKVEPVSGVLSDHYDPRSRTLRLSPDVYGGTSVAATGVAAHEVGHAIQHARKYWPLQVRSYLAPAAAFGGNISMIVFIVGMAVGAIGLAKLGVLLFSLMVAFTLITLPVEFDASSRAKALLPELGLTHGPEGQGVARVLNAAAMTYVAGAVSAIATLVYLVIRSGFGSDD